MRIAPTPIAAPIGGEISIERTSPTGVGAGEGVGGISSAEGTAGSASVFERAFADAIGQAAQRSQVADAKVQALAAGTGDDLHGTLISTKEADISLKLVNTVRNKVLDAFHELWRTNV